MQLPRSPGDIESVKSHAGPGRVLVICQTTGYTVMYHIECDLQLARSMLHDSMHVSCHRPSQPVITHDFDICSGDLWGF